MTWADALRRADNLDAYVELSRSEPHEVPLNLEFLTETAETIRALVGALAEAKASELSPAARVVAASLADPSVPSEDVLAAEHVWAELRALVPPCFALRSWDGEGDEPEVWRA